jgi:uncharacterized protein
VKYQSARAFIIRLLKRDLSENLYYHCLDHTLDVLAVTKSLCLSEKIGSHETVLLRTAALFHDSGFTRSLSDHEKHGCDIAREMLPTFDYITEDIERICGMIMATKIPQTPHNLLEQIICDADLDYLGRDDFGSIGNLLFKELKGFGILDNEKDWNRLQVRFLESHAYFTRTNNKKRAPVKAKHLAELRALVASYGE